MKIHRVNDPPTHSHGKWSENHLQWHLDFFGSSEWNSGVNCLPSTAMAHDDSIREVCCRLPRLSNRGGTLLLEVVTFSM